MSVDELSKRLGNVKLQKTKCISKNKKGGACRFYSINGTEYCKLHAAQPIAVLDINEPSISLQSESIVENKIDQSESSGESFPPIEDRSLIEIIANDMTREEYDISVKIYEEILLKMEKILTKEEMNKWIYDNNLPNDIVLDILKKHPKNYCP